MTRPLPFVVALTGGIASGKSTVAHAFAALGVPVIDADTVAREIVEPGSPALADIVEAFGSDVLDGNGALDRRAMRERIFSNAGARKRIDDITHPRIRRFLRERATAIQGPYVLLVVPLLVESGGHYDWVDRVLVVDAPRSIQHTRLLARDGITDALANAMLDAQVSHEQRLAIADDVIANVGPPNELATRVAALHENYLRRARQRIE